MLMDKAIKETIELAIKKESSAYGYYLALSKKSDNINAQTLFATLAIQELRHEGLLKEYLLTEDFLEAKEKVMLKYDDNFLVTNKLNPSIEISGLREGLKVAINREREALKMYKELIELAKSPGLKDLFFYLAQEEETHERLLRKEYQKLFNVLPEQ